MDSALKKVELSIPEVDMALLKELAKKFGWSIGKKKSRVEKGLDDIKAGRVSKAKEPSPNVIIHINLAELLRGYGNAISKATGF